MGWILPLLIIPNFSALPPIYAKSVFGGGPQVLGLLLSSVGLGGIAGGLVAASISRVDRRGIVQVGAMLLLSASLIGFALSPELWMASPFLVLAGFFEMIFLTGNQTLLQLSIPDELRGRVTSITTLSAGLMPIGSLVAGFGSDLVGPREVTIIFCSLAATTALLVFLLVPLVRNYRLSAAIANQREYRVPAAR
jgi:MFS family permease